MRSVLSVVLRLISVFSLLGAVFVGFSRLLFEVLALSRFLRLISCFRNLMLCSLLAVLYAKCLREPILAAISGVKSDVIFSSSCRC